MAALSEAGLRHVRDDELHALKERLAHHLPHSFPVYGSVCLAVRYGLHSLRPASILMPIAPRPSCFTVITQVTTSSDSQSIMVFWSLDEHGAKDVAQHFSCIPDLDWSQPVLLLGFPNILMPSIESVNNVGGKRVRIQALHQGHLYNIQAAAMADMQLPSMYHMTRLKEEDASKVRTNWDFSNFDTEDNIRQDIIYFPSVGIRECGTTDNAESPQEADGTLVSWVRSTKLGWMGNTFTLPQHRRRGLAGMATVALARHLLQEGLLAYVAIENKNTGSIKFHESLGFERQSATSVILLVPAEAADQDFPE